MLFAASFPSLPPLKPLLYYSTLYYSTQASILPFLKPLHCSTQNHQTSTLLLYSNIYTTLLYQTNKNTLTSSTLVASPISMVVLFRQMYIHCGEPKRRVLTLS